ncbi:MAG: hypothetical protein K0Q65_1107 [Clostridia bacterium]|nr:hypothetical protein [Clostridia bacterium]
MQFPTGGKAREQCVAVQIRLNSEADSKVWMEEDRIVVSMTICVPEVILQGLFIMKMILRYYFTRFLVFINLF